MKNITKNIIKFIADSNLWLALATAFFYWLTLLQLEQKIDFSPTVIILFFSTLFTYTFFKTKYIQYKNIKLKWYVVGISFAVMLACIPFLSFNTLSVLAIGGVLSFFYATPMVRVGKNRFNFRKYWYLKSIIIALVWTLSCATIPLLEFNATKNQLIWFSLEKFLFILSIALPYDIKDIAQDSKPNGIKSFAMKFGISKTKWISNSILSIAFLLALWLYPNFYIALLISYSFAFFLNYKLNINTSFYWYTFLIDATIILYFCTFLVSSYFFM